MSEHADTATDATTSTQATNARILVVEDDVDLAAGIVDNLVASGYDVDTATDGVQALAAFRSRVHDLVVLDIMLPELDGLAICKIVRDEGNTVPILFLTGLAQSKDRIAGLEAGGDDYLAKPFQLREFLLRVESLLRRSDWGTSGRNEESILRFGGNEVDLRTLTGQCWNGARHLLESREAALLKLLAERVDETVTREEILDSVWGWDERPSSRRLERYVRRLQQRFERTPDNPRHLHNMGPMGYRFTFDAGDDE